MKSMILAVTTLIFISTSLLKGAVICGTVVMDNDSAAIGAIIRIDGTKSGAFTNAEGKFTISDVAAGNQNLRVSYIGYEEYEMEIEVNNDELIEVKIKICETEFIIIDDYLITRYKPNKYTIGSLDVLVGIDLYGALGVSGVYYTNDCGPPTGCIVKRCRMNDDPG